MYTYVCIHAAAWNTGCRQDLHVIQWKHGARLVITTGNVFFKESQKDDQALKQILTNYQNTLAIPTSLAKIAQIYNCHRPLNIRWIFNDKTLWSTVIAFYLNVIQVCNKVMLHIIPYRSNHYTNMCRNNISNVPKKAFVEYKLPLSYYNIDNVQC